MTTSSPPSAARTSPSSERAFIRHVRNYLSATTLVGILEFAGIAVFTRLMSLSEYGVYQLVIAAVGVLAIFFELNLRGAVARYYLERTGDFPDFLRTTLVVVGVSTAVFSGVLYLLRQPAADYFGVPPFLLGFVAIAAIAQVPWNILWKLLVAQEKSSVYARLAVARSTLTLVVGVAALCAVSFHLTGHIGNPGEGLLGREYGVLGAVASVALLFGVPITFWLIRDSKGGRLNKAHVRYGLLFGVPLIAHSLSTQILTFFDRFALNQLEDSRAVGLYSFAYNVGMAMGAVVTAMNQAWLPVFMDLRREERYDELNQLARKYGVMVSGAALLFVLFARELGTLLGDERFHEALPLVPVIVFAYVMVFIYTIYANHSFYLKRTWIISVATVAAGALNIVLNYWLIPDYGYIAAAWTTLISYVALAIGHYGIARFVQKERTVPIVAFAIPILVAAGIAFAFVYLEGHIENGWVSLLAVKLPIAFIALVVFRHARRRGSR